MEDYIFIIIAIILSVLGAFNKKNKKKLAQMEKEEANDAYEPSFFEKQFSDPFFDDDFEPEPEMVAQPEPKVEVKTPPAYETKAPKMEKMEVVKLVEEEEDSPKETRLDSLMKDFSLKKAVIYSEILNRKY